MTAILIGAPEKESTDLAKRLLDEAKIKYEFSPGVDDGLDGPMPQLLAGLEVIMGINNVELYCYNKIHGTDYIFS